MVVGGYKMLERSRFPIFRDLLLNVSHISSQFHIAILLVS